MTRTVDPILEDLRQKVLRMGGLAEEILEKSTRASSDLDAVLAREVEQDDLKIDRLDVEIDAGVLRA